MPPAPVNQCPANANDLVPLIDKDRKLITDPAEARSVYQSTFSNYPPEALCQKDGAMCINYSHPVLARMEASESLSDLSDDALLEKIQGMEYENGGLKAEQIELIAEFKNNKAQLKQLQDLGFKAEKFMQTLGKTVVEFGPLVGGFALSFKGFTNGISWLTGFSNLLANLGPQNTAFQKSTIDAFMAKHNLCGKMGREIAHLIASHVLNTVLLWYAIYGIAKLVESIIKGSAESADGSNNLSEISAEDARAVGSAAHSDRLAELNAMPRTKKEEVYLALKKEREGLQGENAGLRDFTSRILTEITRLQKIHGSFPEDDSPLSLLHSPDSSQSYGALAGFGALGALAAGALIHAIKGMNRHKPLTPHQLRNLARAKQRIIGKIADGALKRCNGQEFTKDEMRAFANEFFNVLGLPAPQNTPKPAEGNKAAPADGTRAELEITRVPTSAAQPVRTSERPIVRPFTPDGVPSPLEGTPVPAAMRAEWTAREQANAIWRQFTQNAEVVPQRRHQEATLIDMAYKTYQDLIKIMPPHTWDKIAWDMAHMYRIAVLTTHGDVHAQMFRGRDVYAAFWKKFGLRINLYDIWLESAKPAGMIDTMANVLQRTGMNHPSLLLTQAAPVILAAAKEGARTRGEPWGPQDEKRAGEDIHALAGLFNAERAARLANNVLTITEATKRLVWSLWHMGSAARGGLRLLPAAAWYGSLHPLQASELLSQALATGAGKGGRGRATARTGGPSPRGRVLGKLGAAYNTFAWALFGAEVYIHFDNTPAPSNWRSLSPTQRTGWVISEVGFVFAEGTSSLVCNVLPGATSIIPKCNQYIVPENPCPEGSVHMKPDFGPLFGLSPHCVPMR